MYATPFVLDQDKTNKHRIHQNLESTTEKELTTMIPFLRDHDALQERVKAENDGRQLDLNIGRSAASRKCVRRRELSWNNYSRPISFFNE
jgi:hypothetical protein